MKFFKRILQRYFKRYFSKINVSDAKIDEMVYLIDYKEHYSEILLGLKDNFMSNKRLAELLVFRAWTAQFGYRIFSTDEIISEKLIGETVNSCKYLGLGIFQKIHGFSVEAELDSDFITLIESRWREYDLMVSTMPKIDRIPTSEIISVLTWHLGISDPTITYKLSIDFLAQLDFLKKTALDLRILTIEREIGTK